MKRRRSNPRNEFLLHVVETNNGREYELLRAPGGPRDGVASLHVSNPVSSGRRPLTFFVYPIGGVGSRVAIGSLSAAGDVVWRKYRDTSEVIEDHGMLFDELLAIYFQDPRPGEYTVRP